MSEAGLAHRARRGDRDALRELYDRYAARLWREVLWPHLGDVSRCEDALCETFLSALQALPRFRPGKGEEEGLWPWLRRIARHKALDEWRRSQRRGRLEEQVRVEVEAQAPAADPQALSLRREEAMVRAERVGEVLAAIHGRYAEVLRLRLQQGLSRDECAERMGVKVATFDVLLLRSVRAFRAAYLARYGVAPEEE